MFLTSLKWSTIFDGTNTYPCSDYLWVGVFYWLTSAVPMQLARETLDNIVITLQPKDREIIQFHIKKWQNEGQTIPQLSRLIGVSKSTIYESLSRGSIRLETLAALQRAFRVQLIPEKHVETMVSNIRKQMTSSF